MYILLSPKYQLDTITAVHHEYKIHIFYLSPLVAEDLFLRLFSF